MASEWLDEALCVWHIDVFRDTRSRAGRLDDIFHDEIKSSNFFVAIMTPASLREDSYCQKEIAWANENACEIIPIRLSLDTHEIWNEYLGIDFSKSRDRGFLELTEMLLGERKSRWEHLILKKDTALLLELENGHIPPHIAKAIGDWVVMERLWAAVDNYLAQFYDDHSVIHIRGTPQTPMGVWRTIQSIASFIADERDGVSMSLLMDVKKTIQEYLDQSHKNTSDPYQIRGSAAAAVIKKTKEILQLQAAGRNVVNDFAKIQNFYDFDVTEKLRVLISEHVYRSKNY